MPTQKTLRQRSRASSVRQARKALGLPPPPPPAKGTLSMVREGAQALATDCLALLRKRLPPSPSLQFFSSSIPAPIIVTQPSNEGTADNSTPPIDLALLQKSPWWPEYIDLHATVESYRYDATKLAGLFSDLSRLKITSIARNDDLMFCYLDTHIQKDEVREAYEELSDQLKEQSVPEASLAHVAQLTENRAFEMALNRLNNNRVVAEPISTEVSRLSLPEDAGKIIPLRYCLEMKWENTKLTNYFESLTKALKQNTLFCNQIIFKPERLQSLLEKKAPQIMKTYIAFIKAHEESICMTDILPTSTLLWKCSAKTSLDRQTNQIIQEAEMQRKPAAP